MYRKLQPGFLARAVASAAYLAARLDYVQVGNASQLAIRHSMRMQ